MSPGPDDNDPVGLDRLDAVLAQRGVDANKLTADFKISVARHSSAFPGRKPLALSRLDRRRACADPASTSDWCTQVRSVCSPTPNLIQILSGAAGRSGPGPFPGRQASGRAENCEIDKSVPQVNATTPPSGELVPSTGGRSRPALPTCARAPRGGGRQLTTEGVALTKPDRGSPNEQDDSDDREPNQTLEGEPDNHRDKPEHEQNDDENEHANPPNDQERGVESCILTYSSRARERRRVQPVEPRPTSDSLHPPWAAPVTDASWPLPTQAIRSRHAPSRTPVPQPITGTADDTLGLPDGEYSYTVTQALRRWTDVGILVGRVVQPGQPRQRHRAIRDAPNRATGPGREVQPTQPWLVGENSVCRWGSKEIPPVLLSAPHGNAFEPLATGSGRR